MGQVGRLALGAAGAAAGSFIGAPNLGFMAGSLAGGAIFGGGGGGVDRTVQGPRLQDQDVSSSAYGKPINRAWGSMRLASNMIWATDIVEEKETETVQTGGGGGKGGGGGGGSTTTRETFKYFANMAAAFGEGEADEVLRIWMDGDLVYDATPDDAVDKEVDLDFRFYPGSETQEPDPLIREKEGEDRTPAFRGLVYIVFEHLPLRKFGNRIPNVQAEITFKGEEANSFRDSEEIENGDITGVTLSGLHVDYARNKIYQAKETPDDNQTGKNGIRVYDLTTFKEIRQVTREEMGIQASPEGHIGTQEVRITALGRQTGNIYSKSVFVYKLDPTSLTAVSALDEPLAAVTAAEEGLGFGRNGQLTFLVTSEYDTVRVLDFSDNSSPKAVFKNENTGMADEYEPSEILYGGVERVTYGQAAVFWYVTQRNDNIVISKYLVKPDIDKGVFGAEDIVTVDETLEFDILSSDKWGPLGFERTLKGVLADEEDRALIIIVGRSDDGDDVVKWNDTDGIVLQFKIENFSTGGLNMLKEANFSRGQLILQGYNVFTIVDTRQGQEIFRIRIGENNRWEDFDPPLDFGWPWTFNSIDRSVLGRISNGFVTLRQVFLGRSFGNGVFVSEIVRDLSEDVGLDPNFDIDVSEIDQSVTGYALSSQESARDSIEPLAQAFLFEGVEIDDRVKFVPRGQNPVRTITEDELTFLNEGEVVDVTRVQEVELPEKINVRYKDVTMDFQVGTQLTKRIQAPKASMRSRKEETVDLNMALEPSQARQISEKLLFLRWAERERQNFNVSWKHIDLIPSDVVKIARRDGREDTVRITRLESSPSLTLSIEGLREETALIQTESMAVSESEGAGNLGFKPQKPNTPVSLRSVFVDVPLIRDRDNNFGGTSNLLATALPFSGNLRGATIFESDEGNSFDSTGERILEAATGGTVIGSLDPTDLPFQTDTHSEIDVVLEKGELASVTDEQFFKGENAAIIGDPNKNNWEIVLFKNATQINEMTWRLNTFIRGFRGTDVFVNTHSQGETFIFLQPEFFGRINLALEELDDPRFYRIVPDGTDLNRTRISSHLHTGKDLKPYAPVHLGAALDGSDNINISWVRRTRLGGTGIKDNKSTVPVSEESEAYEVDILDGPDGSVLRTLETDTPSVQYANADVVNDFGSVPSQVTFTVYQMSAAVGRGFPQKKTVTL